MPGTSWLERSILDQRMRGTRVAPRAIGIPYVKER